MSDVAGALPLTSKRLETAARAGCEIALWWRDDDARHPSPALDRLLTLRSRAGTPLALAVIPEGTGADLSERLEHEPGVVVLQHGLAHRNHAPTGQKRAEFGDHRPTADMLAELATGRHDLARLFGRMFLPVFVPPWNRIGPQLAARLSEAGLDGLSVFADAAPGRTRPVNTHLDLMEWHPGKGLEARGLAVAAADRLLAGLIDLRLERFAIAPSRDAAAIPCEPIGLLTHHLQHDETAWATLDAVLDALSRHRAVVWPSPQTLFAAAAGETRAASLPRPV